jgi:hypothetical protein
MGLTMAYEFKEPFFQYVYQWQTLIAGVLALVAAGLTIRATNNAAAREVAAAQEQTAVILRVERRRIARESFAFFATLEAAMGAVMDDIESARAIFAGQSQDSQAVSVPAYAARQRVKKTAFEDIRSACLKFGGQLTAPFLRLDKEIDNFSSQTTLMPTAGEHVRMGANAGLLDQLSSIELQANALREEAGNGMKRCTEMLAEMQDAPLS